jgi:hypothetical protein
VPQQPEIERRRLHAGLPQRRHLVFHQRDQRRDDEADSQARERRDLVAERLAAAVGIRTNALCPAITRGR